MSTDSVRLEDLEPYEGTRDYLEREWFSPGDLALCHDVTYENHEAWSGRKYNDYGGYGHLIKPRSILEVGVASGYSMAAMLYGYGNAAVGRLRRVVLIDIHPDVFKAEGHLMREFPMLEMEGVVSVHCIDSQKDWALVAWEPFDIVHIDGDHTYAGAFNDLKHFGPMVSRRGLIIVDDAKDPNIYTACQEYARTRDMDSRFIANHNGHYLMMRSRT